MHRGGSGSTNRSSSRNQHKVSPETVTAVEAILGLKLTKRGRRWAGRALVHKTMHQGKVRTWVKYLENCGDRILSAAVSLLLLRSGTAQLLHYHTAHSLLVSNALWSRIARRTGLVQHMIVAEGEFGFDSTKPPKEFADIMEVLLAVVALESGREQNAINLVRRLLQPELTLPQYELVARYHKAPRTIGDLTEEAAARNGGNGHGGNQLAGVIIPQEIVPIIEAARDKGPEVLGQIFRRRRNSAALGRRRESPQEVLDRALREIGLSAPQVRVARNGRRVEVRVESGGWDLAMLCGRSQRRLEREATLTAVRQLKRVLVEADVIL